MHRGKTKRERLRRSASCIAGPAGLDWCGPSTPKRFDFGACRGQGLTTASLAGILPQEDSWWRGFVEIVPTGRYRAGRVDGGQKDLGKAVGCCAIDRTEGGAYTRAAAFILQDVFLDGSNAQNVYCGGARAPDRWAGRRGDRGRDDRAARKFD